MEKDYCSILSKNICLLRKAHNLTQEELANRFGISFQAISKWENASTSPDITLLPLIAKEFSVTIDQLFDQVSPEQINFISDEPLKVCIYQGDKLIMQKDPLFSKVTINLTGKPKDLTCYGNITVDGELKVDGGITVSGDIKAEQINCGGISCLKDMIVTTLSSGGITTNGDIKADRINSGGLTVRGDLTATKLDCGGLTCHHDIKCDELISKQNLNCKGDITCNGSISANIINGEAINKQKEVFKPGEVISHDDDQNNDYEDLQQDYEDLQEEYDDLQDEYDDLESRYDDLQRQFDELKK